MGAKPARSERRRAIQSVVMIVVAVSALAGCAVRSPGLAAYPELAGLAGREIARVTVIGADPFSGDTLAAILDTEPTHCSLLGLPICIPGTRIGRQERELDLDVLYRDVARLELFYRRAGFFGTEVAANVEPSGEDEVEVVFVVARGDLVTVGSLTVLGVDGILDVERVSRRLPLREGDSFDLTEFAASADTVLRALRDEGYAYAEVLRSYDVDLTAHRAEAVLTAVPGPRVVVDSIVVTGAGNLGRRDVLRQLAIRQGDLLRLDRLVESERNLYALDIVQFASVEIAPESMQRTPADSATATLLVSVSEGPVHVVDATIGYGSVECLRAQGRWVSRSFGGGARRLVLVGYVSKIGIAPPLDFGLGGICRAYRDDPFQEELDYRLSGEWTQPYFLGPRNHLTVTAWVERISEPRVFQRESTGAGFAVRRRLSPRSILTWSIDAAYGRTRVADAVFCLAFEVCDPADLAALERSRWLNTLDAAWVRDRTDVPVDPTRGVVHRIAATWAPAWLGSDAVFVRSTGDLEAYARLGGDNVGVFYLRLGSIFGSASVEGRGKDFLPPEQRFYAGGAGSVRGFERNAMGPGVYVAREGVADPVTGTVIVDPANIRFFPIGGTTVVTTTAELRFPAPIMRGSARLALFVDAGALTNERAQDMDGDDWVVTPGLGIRVATPVGPLRLDVAYNPHAPQRGPLYVPAPAGDTLVRVADDFRPERQPWHRRIQIHLGIGRVF